MNVLLIQVEFQVQIFDCVNQVLCYLRWQFPAYVFKRFESLAVVALSDEH